MAAAKNVPSNRTAPKSAAVRTLDGTASLEPEPESLHIHHEMRSGNGKDISSTDEADATPEPTFDLASMRLPQNFSGLVGVKTLVTTVEVGKPDKQAFIRTHPDPEYRLETVVLEMKADRASYLVHPSLWNELLARDEAVPKVLFTVINRQGVLSLWPIRLPGRDGRLDAWNQSALEAALLAMDHWVRVRANRALGANEVDQAVGLTDEPQWPTMSFEEIVKIAFKHRYIRSWDDEVLRRLRGEL
jgi:hypothetical protein